MRPLFVSGFLRMFKFLHEAWNYWYSYGTVKASQVKG